MPEEAPRVWSIMPLVFCCSGIFLLSSFPGNAYPQVSWPLADKVTHVGLYWMVGLASALCFVRRGYSGALAVGFGVFYGISDELHQLFVPLRSCSLGDVVADAIGAGAGVFSYYRLQSYLHRVRVKPVCTTSNAAESMELT